MEVVGADTDFTFWQWMLFLANATVALVMTCAFVVAAGGLQYLFFKGMVRRFAAGGSMPRWGESQAQNLEATTSPLIDAQTATARKRIRTGWKVFLACLLYFIVMVFISVLFES